MCHQTVTVVNAGKHPLFWVLYKCDSGAALGPTSLSKVAVTASRVQALMCYIALGSVHSYSTKNGRTPPVTISEFILGKENDSPISPEYHV